MLWIPTLRRFLVLAVLVAGAAPSTAETVRFHVQVDDAGGGAFARQAGRTETLRDDVENRGGTVEPVLATSPALSRALARATPTAYRALERVARWYVVELEASQAAAWKSTAASRLGIERIESPSTIELARAIEIDDPAYPNLQDWTFELIDLERAWAEVRAEQGDVVAAVVDVGFDAAHPDLAPNLWVNPGEIPGNDVDDDGNGYVDDVHGFNVTLGDGDVLYLEEFVDPPAGSGIDDSRRHGTLVAGTLGAVADNGIAGAGVAYNPRLMLVSVQDETGVGLDSTYSYQGILYAALNGASVINCSWRGIWYRRPGDEGRLGSAPFRQFENDIVEAATALGALVVAAAGNDAETELVTSPGHYPDVLAVAATNDRTNPWQLYQNSNAGPWVDIAAPGEGIFVILPDGRTANYSGTSLSAPIVSAGAVLLKTKWPEWTPGMIRARLRATARDLSATEPVAARRDGAGRGMVQIGAAIADPVIPALEIRSVRFVADDGSPIYEAGDDVAVAFEAMSLFPYDGPVTIRLETDDPYLVPFETSLYLSQVLEGVPLSVRRGLELKLRETAPPGHVALVHLVVEAGDEVDRQSFYVDALPYQLEVRSSELELSVSPNAKLGYSEYNRPLATSGVGFRRIGEKVSSLYTGSFVLGTGPNQIVDAIQAFLPSAALEGFRPYEDPGVESVVVQTRDDGWVSTTLRMISTGRPDGLSVRVEQETFAHPDAARGDFLITRFGVTLNGIAAGRASTEMVLENVMAGLLMDWTASGIGEVLHTDPARRTQWAAPREGANDGRFVGMRMLDDDAPLRAAHFDAVGPQEDDTTPFMIDRVRLGQAMPDSMVWEVLSPDAATTQPREGNVVGVLASGPHGPLAVGDSFEVAYVLSIAATQEALFDALDRGRIAWSSLREGRDGTPVARLQILPNVPNPFNPRTTIRFAVVEDGPVTVDLFDARGRRVHRLIDGRVEAGYHRVEWDGRDASGRAVASGVYFVRVHAGSSVASRRLVLVR